MNLKSIFQDFNPSKFLVFTCLLVFCLLFSLRLDESILWSYWVIFLPIWLWKFMVFSGSIVGSYVWWKNPHYRVAMVTSGFQNACYIIAVDEILGILMPIKNSRCAGIKLYGYLAWGEGDSYVQYKAMIMCTGLHMLLLMFELLACDTLESNKHSWILVFVPLMFMSVVSIFICIWSVKNERAFEMELFCSVNILQFIFLALRLDDVFLWSWVIVFIPIWIVMCITLLGLLYAIALAIILLKSPDIIPDQRRGNISTAVGYFFLVVPLLVFEILLANKLDEVNQFKFSAITVPLLMSLVTLICLSFGSKGGNHWWFGIRKDFCQFVLGVCPFLQEYGNISYSLHSNDSENDSTGNEENKKSKSSKQYITDQPRTVISVLSIDMPD